MICHRQKIVFVHLRRTGGNSIETALGGIVLYDRWFRRTDLWDNRLHRGRSWYKRDRRGHAIHATASEIRALDPAAFDRCFRFTIVRNPWEQMASLYARLHAADRGFAGFRDWLSRFRLQGGTVPHESIHGEQGRCLVDFIGRFERLQADFDTACDLAGIPRRMLPRTNAAAGRTTHEIYDASSVRLVARIFAADIERFGYTFDGAGATAAPGRLAA